MLKCPEMEAIDEAGVVPSAAGTRARFSGAPAIPLLPLDDGGGSSSIEACAGELVDGEATEEIAMVEDDEDDDGMGMDCAIAGKNNDCDCECSSVCGNDAKGEDGTRGLEMLLLLLLLLPCP